MNYYYEFPETISVFDRKGGGYYVIRNQQGGNLAEAAWRYATRIWEEAADGVRIIKNYNALSYDKPGPLTYDEQEFLIVKLKARDLI